MKTTTRGPTMRGTSEFLDRHQVSMIKIARPENSDGRNSLHALQFRPVWLPLWTWPPPRSFDTRDTRYGTGKWCRGKANHLLNNFMIRVETYCFQSFFFRTSEALETENTVTERRVASCWRTTKKWGCQKRLASLLHKIRLPVILFILACRTE